MSGTSRLSSFGRIIEYGANVGIILLTLTAGVLMYRQSPARGSTATATRRAPAAGSALKLPGVTFDNAERTLVLVLSSGCHFCSESGPFYRQIAGEARAHGTAIVAVLPQPTEDAADYLAGLGVWADKVCQVSLKAIDTSGTPALILVSKDGIVQKTWIGLLSARTEDEVLRAVKGLS